MLKQFFDSPLQIQALRNGPTKDLRKVALWLGHAHIQTTEIYTRADPSVKREALESVIAPKLRSGRFKATDQLIASLKTRTVMRREQPSK